MYGRIRDKKKFEESARQEAAGKLSPALRGGIHASKAQRNRRIKVTLPKINALREKTDEPD